jgi:hypothetical protein
MMMKYPDRYQKWHNHDLQYKSSSGERTPLWENLRVEDEEIVWLFIEKFYLDKYRFLIKVWPEYCSTGLWKISFPGSLGVDGNVSCDSLGLPKALCSNIQEWQDYFDEFSLPWEVEDPCDYQKLNDWGLALAKEVKRFAPPDYYVEYNSFRELVIIGNEVVELDIPDFIRDLTKTR